MSGEPRLTRRAVLLGALAGVMAACRPRHSARTAPRTPITSVAMHSAYQTELEVVATYESAMTVAGPTAQALIAPLLDDHRRHLSALGNASARTAVFAPTSSHDLAAAERSSASALTKQASAAADGGTTALIASIAASHQAHHERLTEKPFRW